MALRWGGESDALDGHWALRQPFATAMMVAVPSPYGNVGYNQVLTASFLEVTG